MKKKTILISRRQMLHGAGGFTLSLPLLPSLVPVKAYAADVSLGKQAAFVTMVSFNGGAADTNTFPGDEMLTDTVDVVPGHTIRRGKLVRAVDGTDAYLSPILGAPSAELTDRIVSKMNVLRGLDMPYNLGHSMGGFLGNPWGVKFGCGNNKNPERGVFPTIDSFMAWSPSFYKNLSAVRQRQINTGRNGSTCGASFFYSSPTTRSGPITEIRGPSDPVQLFNALFSGASSVPAAAPGRPPVVDRVLESYRLMRNGSRRISADDRRRLDDVMSRLSELQRQLGATTSTVGSCKDVKAPLAANGTYKGENDVISAAFLCGYSRVAFILLQEHDFSLKKWDGGIWHNDITHSSSRPDAQAFIAQAHNNLFRSQFLDLVRKLDVEESPGTTVLDNSIVMWTQECSERTHDQTNIPVIMAGSAGGTMKTGNYVDYRNRVEKARTPPGWMRQTYTGLPWNQLLGTILQAVGVPRSEYETAGTYGYGTQYRDPLYLRAQTPGVWEQSGNFLPFLKA